LKRSIALLSIVFASIRLWAQELSTEQGWHGITDLHYAQVMTVDYIGKINGLAAVAKVSFEPLGEEVLMSGVIQSGSFSYTFTADIYGEAGYGDMVSQTEYSRFHVRINLTQMGFAVTPNPENFDETKQTYYFTRQ
jgi:hypothetical protein